MRFTLFVSGFYLLFACTGTMAVAKHSPTSFVKDHAGQSFTSIASTRDPGEIRPFDVVFTGAVAAGLPAGAEIAVPAVHSRVFTLSDRGPPPSPPGPAAETMRHHKEERFS